MRPPPSTFIKPVHAALCLCDPSHLLPVGCPPLPPPSPLASPPTGHAAPSRKERCASGRYCQAGTFSGGELCPNGTGFEELSWKLKVSCPEGLRGDPAKYGALPLEAILDGLICVLTQ